MKRIIVASYLMGSIALCGCKYAHAESPSICNKDKHKVMEEAAAALVADPTPALSTVSHSRSNTKIQVAILLDTSGSMEGLIEQAKSRLWNIINTLTTLKLKGKTPEIQIALYEYGNDGIRNNEYVRQIVPLSTDLDLISQKLFALTTNGGSEYCGAVIQKAVRNLEWGRNDADIRLIYIAGNEPFTQGEIHYQEAISEALKKDIYVNTIHCGDAEAGVQGKWRDGAAKGKGEYFNINHNEQVRYIATPYDEQISSCNRRLNETYIGYGQMGYEKQMNQRTQDQNAKSISSANEAERAVSKSKSAYKNSSWDLVDLVVENEEALDQMESSELPEEMQNKSKSEIKKLIADKQTERENIQREIVSLAKLRQDYIDEEMKKGGSAGEDLGGAINRSLLGVAKSKGYDVE